MSKTGHSRFMQQTYNGTNIQFAKENTAINKNQLKHYYARNTTIRKTSDGDRTRAKSFQVSARHTNKIAEWEKNKAQ